MGFAWQVQQFRCLRDVVPWPYTCLLGRVASDRHWLCVAGAIFSMPPRSSLWPYFLFVWQVQYFRVLREIPSWPGPMIACDPTSVLRGRCNLFDASEKFSVTLRKVACDPSSFCVAGANVWRQWWPYFIFVRQVQYFRCLREVPSWPYVLFVWQMQYIFDASEKFLRDPDPGVACDPTCFLRAPPSYTLKGGCTYKAICLWTMWFCHFETLPPPQSPP